MKTYKITVVVNQATRTPVQGEFKLKTEEGINTDADPVCTS
jgi:hypothetical protein